MSLALLLKHVVPQLMLTLVPFAGLATLVTVPVPVPFFTTVRRAAEKFTVTVRAAFIVALHEVPAVDEQPAQLVKLDPGSGVAVSAIVVDAAFDDLQTEPQLMGALVAPPPGALPVTVPAPVPVFTTVRGNEVKVAVMVLALLMIT